MLIKVVIYVIVKKYGVMLILLFVINVNIKKIRDDYFLVFIGIWLWVNMWLKFLKSVMDLM